jgi:hypothetical protein
MDERGSLGRLLRATALRWSRNLLAPAEQRTTGGAARALPGLPRLRRRQPPGLAAVPSWSAVPSFDGPDLAVDVALGLTIPPSLLLRADQIIE